MNNLLKELEEQLVFAQSVQSAMLHMHIVLGTILKDYRARSAVGVIGHELDRINRYINDLRKKVEFLRDNADKAEKVGL